MATGPAEKAVSDIVLASYSDNTPSERRVQESDFCMQDAQLANWGKYPSLHDVRGVEDGLKQKGALIKACLNKSTDFAELIEQYRRYL